MSLGNDYDTVDGTGEPRSWRSHERLRWDRDCNGSLLQPLLLLQASGITSTSWIWPRATLQP